MRFSTPSSGLLAAALTATALAVPVAAAGSASAACAEGIRIEISQHKRVFLPVGGTKITFTKPGTHTVEIIKAATLSARYNTTDAEDRVAIREAVQQKWPRVRNSVAVTTGHKVKFSSSKGERVTVVYASYGDRVKWTKVDVDDDCSKTVLDTGYAKFPRKNLDWLFAIAIA